MAKLASVGEVRAWAKEQGFALGDRGRLPAEVWQAWEGRNSTKSSRRGQQTGAKQPDGAAATVARLEARVSRLEASVSGLISRLEAANGQGGKPQRMVARTR